MSNLDRLRKRWKFLAYGGEVPCYLQAFAKPEQEADDSVLLYLVNWLEYPFRLDEEDEAFLAAQPDVTVVERDELRILIKLEGANFYEVESDVDHKSKVRLREICDALSEDARNRLGNY